MRGVVSRERVSDSIRLANRGAESGRLYEGDPTFLETPVLTQLDYLNSSKARWLPGVFEFFDTWAPAA